MAAEALQGMNKLLICKVVFGTMAVGTTNDEADQKHGKNIVCAHRGVSKTMNPYLIPYYYWYTDVPSTRSQSDQTPKL